MKDNELLFDRKSHVLYSKPCKKEILTKIALHYPEAERETIWERVQRQYVVFLSDWRTDLGGDAVVSAAYAVMKVLFAAQIGAPVGEEVHILPLHLFPYRLPLHFRVV